MNRSRILCVAAALSCAGAFAGTADVKFIDPARMSDLATNRSEEPDTMKALTQHIQQLAARLPADQVLRVEFLDVDLAGSWHETPRGRVRTAKNRADPPKFHLRWSLESNGQVLRSGEERLTDIDYTNHVFPQRTSTPLYYENRLLDDWFAREFSARMG